MRTTHAVSLTLLLALLGGCSSSNDDDGAQPGGEVPEGSLEPSEPSRPDAGPMGPGVDPDTGVAPSQPPSQPPAQPAQVSLEPIADKTFRIAWQPAEGARSYRVLENPDGASGFEPIGADLDPSVRSLDHRVALYSRLDARYVVQACNEAGCTDSEEATVSGSLERAIGYFKAGNPGADDLFGNAVSLSADGDTMAVGAFGEDGAAGASGDRDDDSVPSAGAVYVFARTDGTWSQQAYLKASNADSGDGFGIALSLSADGATLAVGAIEESSAATGIDGEQSDDSASRAGAVYVFARGEGDWRQQAYLKGSNTEASDVFGRAVSLSANGDTLAVGAPSEQSAATGIDGDQGDNSAFSTGAVYVFSRTEGAWRQQAYVKASNAGSIDQFGNALGLSADGDTLAVGAYGEESLSSGVDGDQSDGAGSYVGAVYVFARRGGSWQQQAYLKASNAELADEFGWAVGLSADGATLAVGAIGEDSAASGADGDQDDNSLAGAGAVYVFVRDDDSWRQQAYLKASNPDGGFTDEGLRAGDFFGVAVSLSADGDILAVGASGEDSIATGIDGDQSDNSATDSGAVYVFARRDGLWQQRAYLKSGSGEREDPFPTAPELGDLFGTTVSLGAEGDTLAVGASGEDGGASGIDGDRGDNSVSRSGAVYLY